MVNEDGPDLASTLLALTEGATDGRGLAGVLVALARAADRLHGDLARSVVAGETDPSVVTRGARPPR